MSEAIVKKLRSGITGSLVLSAIVALVGAIGIFVITGIMNDPYASSGDETALSIIMMVAWDLLRMGGFGMFVCSLISVIFELFGNASGKMYAFVMLGGSIFGLISGFMLSVGSLMSTAISTLSSYGSSYGSSSNPYTVACVFGIISAVIVFVGLGLRSYRPVPLAYPQGYPQQYPQQGYPQQYPQQGYPQQYPQQPVYPQQSVPVQPQQSVPVQPQQSVPVQPQQSVPVQPQQSVPVQPQQSVPVQPQAVDLNKPNDN